MAAQPTRPAGGDYVKHTTDMLLGHIYELLSRLLASVLYTAVVDGCK